MKDIYQVKADGFEGPLHLLLEFIEKEKLSINNISLSKVTDEYIGYVEKMEDFDADEVAAFLVIASTLILIKSRSLLPGLELTEEEEQSIEDLEKRLVLYREIKRVSKNVKELFGKNILVGRESFLGIKPQFIEPEGVDKKTIFESLKNLITSIPIKELIPEKSVEKIVSLEEKMKEIVKRIEDNLEFNFSKMTQLGYKKIEVVISFLAILELVRRGLVMVNQDSHFGDINIKKK